MYIFWVARWRSLYSTLYFVLQWMVIDDLFEQERHIRAAMANRSGVLGLLLHQTIDHDPLHPLKSSTWSMLMTSACGSDWCTISLCLPRMLSPRPGLEANKTGLGLVITGLGLMTVVASASSILLLWPRSFWSALLRQHFRYGVLYSTCRHRSSSLHPMV